MTHSAAVKPQSVLDIGRRDYQLRTQWCFNGEFMTITEFAQRVYGDTPQRTEFLLKYSGERAHTKV